MNQQTPEQAGALVLPFSKDDFGAFISGLLGKPQVIEATLPGVFTITRDDVVNTYHLVHQRVGQQNECNFVQFTVRIVYSDGSSVLLNSLDAFVTHVEVRPVVSEDVHLSWTYLIKFQDKKVPEKQVIELSFVSTHVPVYSRGGVPLVIIGPVDHIHRASANIRISHTARTWGVDLEALLGGHVKSMMRGEPKVLKWIYQNDGWVALIAGVTFFIASSFVAYKTNSDIVAKQLAEVNAMLTTPGNSLAGVSSRLDMLIRNLSTAGWRATSNLLPVQIMVSALASVGFAAVIGTLADNRPKSYVLLSKKAEEKMQKDERKLRRRWWELAVSFILGILGGVISNMLFARM